MRTLYYRKVQAQRIEWQQHPVTTTDDRQKQFSSEMDDSSLGVIEPDEKYLGGFYSIQMYMGYGRGAQIGYGIYVTNKRLFGIAQYRPSFDKTVPLMPENLPQEKNTRMIKELAQTKSLEVPLDRISKIELKIPAGLFRGGYLKITLSTMESMRINVGRKQPGEQLRELFQTFNPSILTVV